MFFDHNLQPLQEYNNIIWDNGCFSNTAKYSQLIYYINQLIPSNKKVCIINHVSQVFDSATTINASDMDLVIVSNSDHPITFHNYDAIQKPTAILNYDFFKFSTFSRRHVRDSRPPTHHRIG